MNELKVGSILNGFILKQEEFVKDINSNVQIFEHEKTGANLMYIGNDDDNKTFSIGFKTPPEDSTGVMHILEHSVLCGSKNFPTKEPFVELCKGSLNTFLNAMTYSDKTVYPVASKNEKDFFNLMHVYLDAVFYPNIYENEKILKQEGWHYHIESGEEDIAYNGVVYNEMKGVYSSPMNQIFRKIEETLYPDNAYGNDSGGNPKCIPNLTYKQFIDTHKKYYHPSNSYITLYGDLDLEKTLCFINDEYLSSFDKKEIPSKIDKQKPFSRIKEHKFRYSVSDESQLENQAYLALNLSVGSVEDMELSLALDILTTLLFYSEEAPLKQSIIDAELGADAFGLYYSELLQPYFSVIVKDSCSSKKEDFEKVVRESLSNLIKTGINKELIEGCINMYEFSYREADSGSMPKGLTYSLKSMGAWIHGVNPLKKLKFEKYFKNIRKALTEPYFENIIEKYILDNTHSSLIVLEPELNLSQKEELELNEKLTLFKNGLKEEELKDLVKETKELLEYQSKEDSEEDLKTIPMLSLEDIEREVEDLKVDEYEVDGVKLLHHDTFTGGISYISTMFDVNSVKEEDISYIGLLSDLLCRVGTKNKSYIDLSNEIMLKAGGLGFFTKEYSNKDNHREYLPMIDGYCKVLSDKTPEAIELMVEIMNETSFEDEKRIKELIKERLSELEMSILSKGHSLAVSRMNSYYSPLAKYSQKIIGLDYYNFLKEIDGNIEVKMSEIKEKLYEVKDAIFNSNNLKISLVGSKDELDTLMPLIKNLKTSISNRNIEKYKYSFDEAKLNEGLLIPSDVQYVAKGYNFKNLGYECDGSIEVLKNILRYGYLWNKIRVQGGAYGAMINTTESGNFTLCSYRDPNVKDTIDAYNGLADFVSNIELSERELEKAIIGTISDMQLPTTPQGKGKVAIASYIVGRTKEERQDRRNEILNTTVEGLRKYSSLIKDVMNADCTVVVGNEKMNECKDLLNEIYTPIK